MPGWGSGRGSAKLGYCPCGGAAQRAARARGEDPAALLAGAVAPAVASGWAQSGGGWALSTHQGAVEPAPTSAEPTSIEFVFRFNRFRRSRSRGMVFFSTVCSSLRPVSRAGALPQHHCREQATGRPSPVPSCSRAGIRRAWTESPPGVRGALRICHTPAKWRARSRFMPSSA